MNAFWIILALLLFISWPVYRYLQSAQKTYVIPKADLKHAKSIHSHQALTLINENPVSFSDYKGKVLLVVNTASKCGLTPQYAELQKLYEKLSGENFEIVGFPSNDFLNQEPGTAEEIQEFCIKNYGVDFQLFEKSNVKGNSKHPVYEFLTEKLQNGVADSKVKWNFQKYLLDQEGRLRMIIYPRVSVFDEQVEKEIKQLMNGE